MLLIYKLFELVMDKTIEPAFEIGENMTIIEDKISQNRKPDY